MLEELEMTPDKRFIKSNGDMIATLMAWLNTPKGKEIPKFTNQMSDDIHNCPHQI